MKNDPETEQAAAWLIEANARIQEAGNVAVAEWAGRAKANKLDGEIISPASLNAARQAAEALQAIRETFVPSVAE